MRLFSPLPTPDEMRAWDAVAIRQFSLPEVMLMENAAREALRLLQDLGKLKPGLEVLLFAGSGNNGGDGFALARHLQNCGCRVLVAHLTPLSKLKGAARAHARMAKLAGVPLFCMDRFTAKYNGKLTDKLMDALAGLQGADAGRWALPGPASDSGGLIIDAINGTGFKGPLREKALAVVRSLNSLAARRQSFVLALDVPSGLDALTGLAQPEAVRAQATLCFEAGKPGLFFPQAQEFTGQVHVRPIGLPQAVRRAVPPSFCLIDPEAGLCARPDPFSHKGRQGRVLVIGGSKGLGGAAQLAALGALRAGAGLVSAACPSAVGAEVKGALPELMLLPLPAALPRMGQRAAESWSQPQLEALRAAIIALGKEPHSALVLGPGLGRQAAALPELLRAALAAPGRPPVVLDADALYFFSAQADCPDGPDGPDGPDCPNYSDGRLPLSLLDGRDILTPHPGEMGRLLGISSSAVQADRPGALRALCAACRAVVVLKGPATLVGQQNFAETKQPIAVSPFSVGNLAVGGAGDVLSGIAAALLARQGNLVQGPLALAAQEAGCSRSFAAACLAVYLHGRSGELLRGRFPAGGNLASEIAGFIPAAMAELLDRV